MKISRKIIKINEELCDGCGLCVPDCAEGSLQIIDGKAKLVADKLCDGLGACLGSCPTGALQIIEREADEFDEEAVEEYLAELKKSENKQPAKPMGCPSAQLQSFQAASPCQSANTPTTQTDSILTHWPVQIRLIPPTAPFLQGADLLVAADCTAVSYPNIQQDYISGKVVMMGCPKFDDQQLYVERFTEIFQQSNIKSLTILIMEVPCCGAMLQIIKQAYDNVKPDISVKQVVISIKGAVISESDW